ncbi:MAG: LemA family protein [Brumimicrobium sp.]
MGNSLYIILAIIALVLFLVNIYNRFVKNKNVVKDAWSNIDVALKRRHDLIPNLVNIVKAYADYEKTTFQAIVEARNKAVNLPKDDINGRIEAEKELKRSLNNFFVTVEAYPELKADQNFVNLQDQLAQIEENLERSRRYYNGTVRINNTYGESIPGVIFAGMFKYQHFDYYEAEEDEKREVDVKL